MHQASSKWVKDVAESTWHSFIHYPIVKLKESNRSWYEPAVFPTQVKDQCLRLSIHSSAFFTKVCILTSFRYVAFLSRRLNS
jgi:hypothetical protein